MTKTTWELKVTNPSTAAAADMIRQSIPLEWDGGRMSELIVAALAADLREVIKIDGSKLSLQQALGVGWDVCFCVPGWRPPFVPESAKAVKVEIRERNEGVYINLAITEA